MARFSVNGGIVWHKNHQGPGTTMDADTVDGLHANQIPSDRRLKQDIKPIEDKLPIEELAKLLVGYRYLSDFNHSDNQRYGVIAQDIEVIPALKELVYTQGNGYTAHLTIDPTSLLFYMIDSLASEVINLKKRINKEFGSDQ